MMDDFKNITIAIDGVTYVIPPAGYFIPNAKGQLCLIGIGSQNSFYGVTLGTTFMRNFFTALNFTGQSISFA
jgi:hypothetical protein